MNSQRITNLISEVRNLKARGWTRNMVVREFDKREISTEKLSPDDILHILREAGYEGQEMPQIRNPITIAPAKIEQLLAAGKKQLSSEEFEELQSLVYQLEAYGLTPWINAQLGKLMAKITFELEIAPSPEWEKALIACDAAFLGNELKQMCLENYLSPMGHKKLLCERLFNASVPAVVEVMEPYLNSLSETAVREFFLKEA